MIFKKKAPIKCFNQEFRHVPLSTSIDLGIRPVEVDSIVGSVGRCMDFREDFDPKRGFKTSKERLEKIKNAMEKWKPLPIIELYKVKDEYYVLDGHHRVVAARELGKKSLDAHILEYLPQGENPKDTLYRERAIFEKATKLWEIKLSEKGYYPTLIEEIERYQKNLKNEQKTASLEDAAKKWHYRIYQPAIEEIEESGVLRFFNGLTPGDLYVCLRRHQELHSQKQSIKTSDKPRTTKDLKKTTENLYSLIKKDRHLTSNETIKELEKTLPPCLYLKFCPNWPSEEKPLSFILRAAGYLFRGLSLLKHNIYSRTQQ